MKTGKSSKVGNVLQREGRSVYKVSLVARGKGQEEGFDVKVWSILWSRVWIR